MGIKVSTVHVCVSPRTLFPLKIAAIFKPGVGESRLAPFRASVDAEWCTELRPGLNAAVILGGDGSVHRHLQRLHEWQIPFLHVPVGSGNDFASSVGIKNPKSALAAWKRFVSSGDNVRAIDLGTIRSCGTSEGGSAAVKYFCNVAYFGIDSDVTRRANLLSPFWRANGGYILSLFPALLRFKPPMMKLTIDGSPVERKVFLAVTANGTRYGRGLLIAPRADMSDGLLDLCLIRALSRLKVATIFPIVYFGQHLRVREVEYLRFRRLRVEPETEGDVYGDGEYVCRTPVEIDVIDRGLRVIVPPGARP